MKLSADAVIITVLYYLLLYSWKLFPNSACSHWLLWRHMTSNNETVSSQNLWAGDIAKSMTSEGNSALLHANVDWRPPFQRGFMNFLLYNKSLKDRSLRKQLILFPSNLNVSQKKKINCFPRDQSLSDYYYTMIN